MARTGLWPTPLATDGRGVYRAAGRQGGPSLPEVLLRYPTPTVCGNHNRKGASKKSGDGIATVLGGRPNPEWLESWFMGWPLGWTDLEPLGTESWRQWLRAHGANSPEGQG